MNETTPIFLTADTIQEIETRMRKADKKYGEISGQAEALGAIKLEIWEVMDAMQARDHQQVYAEMLDVANVAIRYAQALKERGLA